MERLFKNRIDIFNFLRALAFLCVFITHSRIVISANLPAFKNPAAWNWLAYTPAWIAMGMFFLISGYLLGKGFYNGKYKCDLNGIFSFYITRLIRILPMYLFFLLIFLLFISPKWFFIHNWQEILPLFTFTYNGKPGGGNSLGALWFISTIFQLYLLAPLVYKYIFSKIKKFNILILFLIILGGLAYRLIAFKMGLDWYKQIYVPSWANLDFFFAGMLMNSITKDSMDNILKKWLRPISLIVLLILVIHLMFLYAGKHYTFLRYYAPSVFILLYAIIFYAWDSKNRIYSSALTFSNILKNPLRIVDCIGILSFGAYLYHGEILAIMPKLIHNPKIFSEPLSNCTSLIYTYTFTIIALFIWTSILYFCIEKPVNTYRCNPLFLTKIKEFLRGGGGIPLMGNSIRLNERNMKND